nr:hypothetical protein GCM10020093_092130 [Planobispora longispora]
MVPAVQPLLRRYDVRGVLCIGDLFVEPVGMVAACLNLPGAGAGASRTSRNKLLQRTTVPHLSPDFRVVTPGSGRASPSTASRSPSSSSRSGASPASACAR